MEGRFVQLDFSAAFGSVSHGGLLYKVLSIVSEFLRYVKISSSVDVVLTVVKGSILVPCLYYTPPSSSTLLKTILRAMLLIH